MNDKKVLVVDDEKEIASLIQKKLSSVGYEAFTASTGQEALEKAKINMPDIILMDIVLPDLDGAEVVKELKENPRTKDIPVIFLSGIVSAGENNRAEVKVGGTIYKAISKPVTFDDLISEIKEVVERERRI